MEDKPKHEASGMDPFTYAKAEKRQKTEKQNLAQLKNKVHGSAETQKKDVKILAASKGEGPGKSMKLREDADRDKLRKREHKSLAKSLKMAQMSTDLTEKLVKTSRMHPFLRRSRRRSRTLHSTTLQITRVTKRQET